MAELSPSGDPDEMFVIGDLKIRPNLRSEFSPPEALNVYFQVYNAALDQAAEAPALTVRYRILREGKQVKYWSESQGESIRHWSPLRVTMLRRLPLSNLSPGRYALEIEVEDRVAGRRVSFQRDFSVVSDQAVASARQ